MKFVLNFSNLLLLSSLIHFSKSQLSIGSDKILSSDELKSFQQPFDAQELIASNVYEENLVGDSIESDLHNRNLNSIEREVIPYGITMVQGKSKSIPPPENLVQAGNCSDPNSFRVALVDSGIDVLHPDGPCFGDNGTRCIGATFGSATQPWSDNSARNGSTLLLCI